MKNHSKFSNTRKYIELTAIWGNDDASSSIKIPLSTWNQIMYGNEFSKSGWSWYEGHRQRVFWHFNQTKFSIDGDDGIQCVFEENIRALIITKYTSIAVIYLKYILNY